MFIACTRLGIEQARLTGKFINSHTKVVGIYSSPFLRCMETANEIAAVTTECTNRTKENYPKVPVMELSSLPSFINNTQFIAHSYHIPHVKIPSNYINVEPGLMEYLSPEYFSENPKNPTPPSYITTNETYHRKIKASQILSKFPESHSSLTHRLVFTVSSLINENSHIMSTGGGAIVLVTHGDCIFSVVQAFVGKAVVEDVNTVPYASVCKLVKKNGSSRWKLEISFDDSHLVNL